MKFNPDRVNRCSPTKLFELNLETYQFASTAEEPRKMGGRLRKNSAEEVHESFMDLFTVKDNNDSFDRGAKLLFGQHRGRSAEDVRKTPRK